MQKKLLACLLVAPVAGSALANVNIPKESFPGDAAQSVTGTSADYKFDFTDGGLYGPVGVGTVTFKTIKGLPKGDYQIKLTGAANLIVGVDGKSSQALSGSQVVKFTLKSAQDVVVTMSAANADEAFSCANAELELVCNEANIQKALQALLAEVPAIEPLREDVKDEALKTTYANLAKDLKTIQDNIAKVVEGTLTIKDWADFQLYNPAAKTTIGVACGKLKTAVEAYNPKAVAANEAADKAAQIAAAVKRLENQCAAYQKNLDDILAEATKSDEANENTFVNSTIKESADAFQAKVDALKAAIEAQKGDLAIDDKGNIVGFKYPEGTTYGDMKTAIDNLKADLADALALQNAWNAFQAALPALTTAYNENYTLVNSLEDVLEGGDDVFGKARATCLEAIKALYNKNNNSDGALKLGSPVADLEEATKAIPGAIDGIKALYDEFKTLVETQNAEYTKAQTAIEGYQKQLEGKKLEEDQIPADQVAKYNESIKKVDDAIAALQKYVSGQYADNTLPGDDYAKLATAVENALNSIPTAQEYEPLLGLAELMQKADDKVKEISDALDKWNEDEKTGLTYNLYDKFKGQIAGLKEACAAVTPGDAAAVETVTKAIEAMNKTAQDLSDAYKACAGVYGPFKTALGEYETFVNDKYIVPGAEFEKAAESKLAGLQAELKKYADALAAAAAQEAQNSYNTIVALQAQMEGYNWEETLGNAKQNFDQNGSNVNQQFVSNMRAQLRNFCKQYADIPNFQDAADKLEANMASEAAQVRKQYNLGNYTATDEAAKAFMDKYGDYKTEITNYVDFLKQLSPLDEALTSAQAFLNPDSDPAPTVAPALEFFKNLVSQYGNDLTALRGELGDALANAELTKGMEGEEGFTARANALENQINGVEERVKVNQAAYSELLEKSQAVLTHIDDVIAKLKENCGDEEALASYLKQLNELKTKDLANVDVAMTGDFAKGNLKEANKNGYINDYDDISKKADEIYAGFTGEVGELNAATAGEWESDIAALRSLKDEAVRVYNTYLYDLRNKGYREYVSADLLTHQALYDYTTKITQLESSIDAFITENDGKGIAFSKADFDKVATTPMADLKAAIEADQNDLISTMNRLGTEYWTDQSEYRDGVYEALVQAMTAAGMFEMKDGAVVKGENGAPVLCAALLGKCEVLQAAIDSKFSAAAAYETAKKAGTDVPAPEGFTYKNQIGFAMDAIATLLDKVDYNEGALEGAADILWDALYKAYADEAAADLASVDTADDYKFATGEQKDAVKETIKEQISTGVTYNEQLTAEDSNTFAGLQEGAAAALDELDANIKAALETLKKQSAANKASQDLYEEYTGTDGIIPDLNDELKALEEYAASLAADSKGETISAIAGAKTAVDNLNKFVEENKAELSSEANKNGAEALKDAATQAIEDAYTGVRNAETALLNDIMVKVREAFNNAKAAENAGWSDEAALAMEKKIDEAIAAIAGLKDLDNADFQTAAQTLETNLCGYLAELEGVYTPEGTDTAAADAQARLTEQYNKVQEAIATAQAELDTFEPSVKADFQNALLECTSTLENIKNEFSNAGPKVVALEGNFSADLDDVLKMKDEVMAQAAEENAAALAQKAIAAHAAELQEQIDGYTKQLEELRSYLSTYQLDTPEQLGGDLDNIARMIAQMQSTLDEMVADKTLKADTELSLGAQVKMMLANLNYYGRLSAVDYVNNIAVAGIAEARTALSESHLLGDTAKEISEKLKEAEQLRKDAWDAFEEAMNTYESSERTDADFATFSEEVEKAITDLNKAWADANALKEQVLENAFTPGDVDLEPDGVVSVADFQQVLTWIGEGVTYDDLLETNPRQAYAADVNGNKNLNITDAVAILNIALEDLNAPTAAPRMLAKAMQETGDNHIGLTLKATEDGVREYAVVISNSATFVAGQLDLKVGAGMEIVDVELTGRAADHQVYRFDNNEGARVIIASMTNAALQGNDGAMLIVRTRGAGNLEVEDAIFADAQATGYGLGSIGLMGIDSITEGYQNVKERIYNVAGQALDRVQRGINIIRHSDGTTTKERH